MTSLIYLPKNVYGVPTTSFCFEIYFWKFMRKSRSIIPKKHFFLAWILINFQDKYRDFGENKLSKSCPVVKTCSCMTRRYASCIGHSSDAQGVPWIEFRRVLRRESPMCFSSASEITTTYVHSTLLVYDEDRILRLLLLLILLHSAWCKAYFEGSRSLMPFVTVATLPAAARGRT